MPSYVLKEWEIRRRLDGAGKTIDAAASALGVNRATLSAQLNGLRPVSLGVALGLADLLGGVDVREIVEAAPVDIAPKNAAGLALNSAAAA